MQQHRKLAAAGGAPSRAAVGRPRVSLVLGDLLLDGSLQHSHTQMRQSGESMHALIMKRIQHPLALWVGARMPVHMAAVQWRCKAGVAATGGPVSLLLRSMQWRGMYGGFHNHVAPLC